MEYFYKAKTTWQCFSKGDWAAVLEAEPSRRPPLTALILYPIGFNTSIQSFYFRSTFVPILLASLALLLPLAFVAVRRLERILAVAIACAGASMPMLYHFEPNSIELNSKVDSYWGLVDPTPCRIFCSGCGFCHPRGSKEVLGRRIGGMDRGGPFDFYKADRRSYSICRAWYLLGRRSHSVASRHKVEVR